MRVFRFHAAAQAEALKEAVERATFDEALKDSLRQLIRKHLTRVDEEAGRISSATTSARPIDDLLDQADQLSRDFNDHQVADWLDEHPAAYQPVQEQIALAEACGRAVADEPDAIVRAAVAAGLAPAAEVELRKTVNTAHERLKAANAGAAKRLADAEAKVGPPPAPAPATSGPQPSEKATPPVSPEVRAVQLIDALTEVEVHERGVAVSRELRLEVEKLLSQPSQRKVFDDEMLRWLQNQVPAEPSTRDASPKDASRSRPPAGARDANKPPASPDPGF